MAAAPGVVNPARPVLVVDDDAQVRALLTLALTDEGYGVVTAPDGKVALERVAQHQPQLIVLDVNMPEMDGRAFLARYRLRPGAHAPVVLTTAGANKAEVADLEADAFLGKPFDLDDVGRTVAALLAPGPDARRAA